MDNLQVGFGATLAPHPCLGRSVTAGMLGLVDAPVKRLYLVLFCDVPIWHEWHVVLTRIASFLSLFSPKTASLEISREEPASPQKLPAAVSLLQGGDYAARDTASVVRLSNISHLVFWCPAFLRGE